jgi:hypothetical protein
MKKILLLGSLLIGNLMVFATTTTVTPATYVDVYNSAADGDVLLLDAGTYSTALNFPVAKAITLKKLDTAASTPVLTFSWTTATVPTAGSSLILDGLEINLNNSYVMQLAANVVIDKFILKNCIIGNVKRCIIRATSGGSDITEVTVDNCIVKDCGADGWSLFYTREIIRNLTFKNSTLYNYGGESIFLANTNAQTHTFTFNMQNNTIYKAGKDGATFAWCTIPVAYASTSTYNMSNNIFDTPFTTADTRSAFIVLANSGTVTCKNNLAVNYPNIFTTAPGAGWTTSDNNTATTTYYQDVTTNNFTLSSDFPYKGTDNNYLGAPRWWPTSTSIKNINGSDVEMVIQNGVIKLASANVIESVEVYNVVGTKLASQICNNKEASINTGNFIKGIHLVVVKSEGKTITKKIVL